MMRVLSVFLGVLFVFSLSACQVSKVKGKIGGVEVEVEDEDSKKESSSFCPPGQAKKGNC
ncbi:MAG TPA: hypothetical protein VLB09_02560 [Nitrospiria bacterium]|nr:hypothetical protein [Nitrospiria bacterium]